MTSDVMNWDDAYRSAGSFEGPPPWNIGEPQPELAALHREGRFRSPVLDAGCGHAELSLALAADGYGGGDGHQPHRDRRGRPGRTGTEPGHSQFRPGRHHLVHRLRRQVQHRRRQHAVPLATRRRPRRLPVLGAPRGGAGAQLFILVFAKGAFPPDLEVKPHEVDEDELRAAVSRYWEIDDVRPAFIHANALAMPDLPAELPHGPDEKNRVKFPAFLLTAHKPEHDS